MSIMRFFLTSLILLTITFASASEIKFDKKKIKLNGHVLTVEIADTPEKSAQGLMYRKSMPQNEGMLFLFQDEDFRTFWMKNTFLALSIGYFNSKKELIDMQNMTPVKSVMEEPKTYPSNGKAQYVLEVNQGWFEKNKIKLGQKFEFLK